MRWEDKSSAWTGPERDAKTNFQGTKMSLTASTSTAGPTWIDRYTNETTKLLMCGGLAGAISKTSTAPLARLTILYQVGGISSVYNYQYTQQGKRPSVFRGLQHVVRTEGLLSLWKGNGVTILHRIPYSAANFWTYEKVNELWKDQFVYRNDSVEDEEDELDDIDGGREYVSSETDMQSISRRLVAGGTAGMVACTIAYPLDLIRTRLAAQSEKLLYDGALDAVKKIVKEEGTIGLYRGLGATLLQVTPSLGINYAAYETARSKYMKYWNEEQPTISMSLTCGSVAGLVSSTATFPLDLVRRRLQLQGQSRSSKVYGSYAGAFKDIIVTEGWRGLYSGILPEYYKVIPGVAIAFCAYEFMKMSLHVETNARDR
jgi:solute carrier family 25 phosphate transporter 23/24/25/41